MKNKKLFLVGFAVIVVVFGVFMIISRPSKDASLQDVDNTVANNEAEKTPRASLDKKIAELRQSQEYDKAIELLTNYAEKNPEDWGVRAQIGEFYIYKKDFAKAEENLKMADTSSPKRVFVNQLYVGLYLAKNDFENAKKYANKCLEVAENDVEKAVGYASLAGVHNAMKDFQGAKEYIDKAAALRPGEKFIQDISKQITEAMNSSKQSSKTPR